MSTTTKQPWTADELCRLPEGWRYEIDEGELVIMAPAGFEHNAVVGNVYTLLRRFVHPLRLGRVITNELGVFLGDGPRQILRGVDVAFFSGERLARIGDRKGFVDVPPDLAVEVHDPSEPDLRRKIDQYLAAGVRAVWVVDPATRTLTRYRSGEAPRAVSGPDTVVEESVLPGFACRLRELFEEE